MNKEDFNLIGTRRAGALAWLPLRLGEPLLVALFPRINFWGKLVVAVFFVAFLVMSATLTRIYLPDNPVPITLQTLVVVLTGGLMGWRWGIGAVGGYYLLGLTGLGVFAGGNGGLAYAGGATGGYLIGFVLAAGLVGFLSQAGVKRWQSLWAVLVGSFAVYLPALVWASVWAIGAENMLSADVLNWGFYPFIVGDVLKVVVAALILGGLWQVAERRFRA